MSSCNRPSYDYESPVPCKVWWSVDSEPSFDNLEPDQFRSNDRGIMDVVRDKTLALVQTYSYDPRTVVKINVRMSDGTLRQFNAKYTLIPRVDITEIK
jgi:hypothetical protein